MLIDVVDVWTAYGLLPVHRGVSFTLESGQIAAIVGSNGAGKSTLLKAIAGLLPIKRGDIKMQGDSIVGLEVDAIARRGLVLVPEGKGVFSGLTVRDNLLLGGYLRQNDKAVEADFPQVFDVFPVLADRLKTPAGALSGGQRQMLALARAVLARPQALLLDEPSFGLAPRVLDDIAEALKALRASFGMGIVLVEQNASLAFDVADWVGLMQDAAFVSSGPTSQVVQDGQLVDLYLGRS